MSFCVVISQTFRAVVVGSGCSSPTHRLITRACRQTFVSGHSGSGPAVFFFISGGRGERERKVRLDTPASFPCYEGMGSKADKSRVWNVN